MQNSIDKLGQFGVLGPCVSFLSSSFQIAAISCFFAAFDRGKFQRKALFLAASTAEPPRRRGERFPRGLVRSRRKPPTTAFGIAFGRKGLRCDTLVPKDTSERPFRWAPGVRRCSQLASRLACHGIMCWRKATRYFRRCEARTSEVKPIDGFIRSAGSVHCSTEEPNEGNCMLIAARVRRR